MSSRRAFRIELEELINKHSAENWSNTPDFILARYLSFCLQAFDRAVVERDRWYLNGEQLTPAMTPAEKEAWFRRVSGQEEPELGVHEHPGNRSECEICMRDPKVQELVQIKKDLEEVNTQRERDVP